MLNAIAPSTTLVSIKENLDWRLMSSTKPKKNDCIRFTFANPYQVDAPETYKSFDMSIPYSQPCKVSSATIKFETYFLAVFDSPSGHLLDNRRTDFPDQVHS